tara:strand:+ start:1275 stop:2294 length:1020 start_codon:yes stop_codon:yes gene_type:complete
MCGIFGFAKTSGHQTQNQLDILRDVFTELTDESSIRGMDSTGISVIQPDSRETFKTLLDSASLVTTGDWADILDSINVDTTIAIGHVRLATHGVVKTRNAHPFQEGSVIGAHNGIIHNYNKVAKSLGKQVPEVDSQVIFQSLNRRNMKDAFEDINGDFAITWIKDSNRKIHLARESGRPMYVSYWKKARVLFWASTQEIMEDSMIRAGLRLPIHKVEEDYIFTYDTDKFSSKPSVDKIPFYTMSQWEKYSPANSYSYYNWDTGSPKQVESTSCDYNPSPATKSLIGIKQEMCSVCYEWIGMDELDLVNGHYMCIDCEYQVDLPSHIQPTKENNNDRFPF